MGVHYQLLKDWVVFVLLFFVLFLLLFLSCCTTSCWRSSSISISLSIKERLLWAFNVDGHIALKSQASCLPKSPCQNMTHSLSCCLMLFLDDPGQSAHPTAAKLSGWGSFLSLCSLGEESTALWCRRCQYQDMIIEPFVPLPKILKTVTCPTEHNTVLHNARSQQIMANKIF